MENEAYNMGSNSKSSSNRRIILVIVGGCLIIAVGLAIGLGVGLHRHHQSESQCPSEDKTVVTSTEGVYRYAAVAADAEVCSKIGSDMILIHNGTAVDGAIAALLCSGVVAAHSMGIGGGFFMTLYDRNTRTVDAVDAREIAPLFATEDMYVDGKASSVLGGSSVAVPGELKGYEEVHRDYGRLEWSTLVQPTIDLCENGVPVTRALHESISRESTKDLIANDPNFSMYYPNGKPIEEGEKVKLPKLAETFKIIADKGARAFYDGELSPLIVEDIKDKGGNITLTDLLSYSVVKKRPINITLNDGLTVYSVPLPSSGAVYEYILNILDGYNFTSDDMSTDAKTVLTQHRIIEAMKFAYAKRTNLGDENLGFVNVSDLVKNMTSNAFGDSIRQKIDDIRTFDTMYYGPTFYDQKTVGTSHLSVIDKEGNAVSVTSTINLHFGSKVKGARTGIIFNNAMDDFSTPNLKNTFGIPPSPANFIKPLKRPLSSMCPAIIIDSKADVVLIPGAAGGSKITTATALVTLYTLRLGLSLPEAVDMKRFHHQLLPKELQLENGFPQVYLDGLKALGHNVTYFNPATSVVQVIQVKDKILYAVSDERKGGKPAGY
ncbi:glutathione hydrolase 1 proenzyme-like [Patella vulgata]|uniref:glutathione hydrolase 1 proenzyme-like n=1 Tax=Patella vulgata TaxID=6465 RepID=UPI0024A9F436|nr:glutathione hydrolase 1 proenzyme-like [Patella vulgata]XP_055957894.1 glutathione hydrolase 1 proenzyme-like [Patella vulgata]